MPKKPPRPCLFAGCVNLTYSRTGYCDKHVGEYTPYMRQRDTRESASRRGYDAEWRKIRAEVLVESRIPKELWSLYDIHHEPPYNFDVEPDHRKYKLTPLLRSEHSKKTNSGYTKKDFYG